MSMYAPIYNSITRKPNFMLRKKLQSSLASLVYRTVYNTIQEYKQLTCVSTTAIFMMIRIHAWDCRPHLNILEQNAMYGFHQANQICVSMG